MSIPEPSPETVLVFVALAAGLPAAGQVWLQTVTLPAITIGARCGSQLSISASLRDFFVNLVESHDSDTEFPAGRLEARPAAGGRQ